METKILSSFHILFRALPSFPFNFLYFTLSSIFSFLFVFFPFFLIFFLETQNDISETIGAVVRYIFRPCV